MPKQRIIRRPTPEEWEHLRQNGWEMVGIHRPDHKLIFERTYSETRQCHLCYGRGTVDMHHAGEKCPGCDGQGSVPIPPPEIPPESTSPMNFLGELSLEDLIGRVGILDSGLADELKRRLLRLQWEAEQCPAGPSNE
jgi:hypothetical protein